MNNPKDMLVSANVCKHPNYRPSVDLVHWYCPDCDEPFGNVMDEFAKLRSERDELVGALTRQRDAMAAVNYYRKNKNNQHAEKPLNSDIQLMWREFQDSNNAAAILLSKHKPE